MASEEADTYLKTADTQQEDAELASQNRRHATTAFLISMAAENATSALIIQMGAKPSKTHRNSLVLHRLRARASKDTRPKIDRIINEMKILEPHVTKTRYPVRRGAQLLAPSEYYTRSLAEELMERSSRVLELVKGLLEEIS